MQIISGGETGVDIGALVGASKAGANTGGVASRDYMTEKGPQAPALKASFGLISHPSHIEADRIFENIKKADATAIFATSLNCPEIDLPTRFCQKLNKEYIVIDPFSPEAAEHLLDFALKAKPDCLNITGNKESQSAGIALVTSKIIYNLISTINKGGCIEG